METAAEFDRSLREAVNAQLVRGSLMSAVLGLATCATMATVQALGLAHGLGLAVVFAGGTGAWCLAVHQLARRRRKPPTSRVWLFHGNRPPKSELTSRPT